MSHVTVTGRHHALFGQRLPLIPVRSARGAAYIVIELPDGRRRSLRRSLTDLAGGVVDTTSAERAREAPRISARTLLPLARHVAAAVAAAGPATPVVEVPYADRCPPAAEPTARADTRTDTDAASFMAELVGRDAEAGRPACRRPAAAADTEPPPCGGDGELSC